MLTAELRRCVAAGCLVLHRTETQLPDELWSLIAPETWHHLGPFPDFDVQHGIKSANGGQEPPQSHSLNPEVQHHLLSPPGCLAVYADILHRHWVYMSLSVTSDSAQQVIVRVYILPDDVDNRTVSRRDHSLRKVKASLLAQLDYSKSTWQGKPSAYRSSYPSSLEISKAASDTPNGNSQTLLQMFNSIPSPDPSPDDILDFDARDAAYRLMSSKVLGLTTTLYSYQRRSAALMLQRESQRQRVLDPRLVKVVDQRGTPWYYDAVTGASLREPRHYDAPCGGILAEEMGAGKTLICLALILATRHIPSATPDHLRTTDPVIRPRVGSLAEMAASCITRYSVPWRAAFGAIGPDSFEHSQCVDAIRRNPGCYLIPRPPRRRESRQLPSLPPSRVFLSHCSLIIVPPNLVQQWKQEIAKHTLGLRVFIDDKRNKFPSPDELVEYDIVLFSSTSFERLWEHLGVERDGAQVLRHPLAQVHFKRCIVDEGHKLGNSTAGRKSNLHLIVDQLHVSAKWIVTGTPSKGLFGVDDSPSPQADDGQRQPNRRQAETSPALEKEDLRRIGSIATLYLKMRPWANQSVEAGDSPADWAVYVMQPRHSVRSTGRADCLKTTLESLIIRHRLSEVGDLLPAVDEKIVYLEGSFQDRLVLNLFSMMIIFNAVQSQRTDQDYFFHPRQRKALIELVSNLRQASFFGGSFFSPDQIHKAIETAEEFLKEGKVQISAEDEALLRSAIDFGKRAENNSIKRCANLFHEVPLYVQNFPWGAGREWSLNLKDGDPVCTDSRLIAALQKLLHPLVDAPTSLQLMFDSGRFTARGWEERSKGIEDQGSESEPKAEPKTLAGNTQLGQDNGSPSRRRSAILAKGPPRAEEPLAAAEVHDTGVAPQLAHTQLISTASAKLSYLIDQIVKYQESEQILIFYENDNEAYYLAGVLEILQVQHLIYAKGLTTERRAQYVATFNQNPKFRVLLMDISQAAFGLDMRSASRIYFLHPVLNPQVEAQAIGRARRISQRRPVGVETLVLRGSVEEVIVRRRREMTQAEQWKCRSILDDGMIYRWILEARILPLPVPVPVSALGDGGGEEEEEEGGGEWEMARLAMPLALFGRGEGGAGGGGDGVGDQHPDRDLVGVDGERVVAGDGGKNGVVVVDRGRKRASPTGSGTPEAGTSVNGDGAAPKKRARVRFAEAGDEGEG